MITKLFGYYPDCNGSIPCIIGNFCGYPQIFTAKVLQKLGMCRFTAKKVILVEEKLYMSKKKCTFASQTQKNDGNKSKTSMGTEARKLYKSAFSIGSCGKRK